VCVVIALGQVQELDRAALQAVCQCVCVCVCGDFNDTAVLTELVGLDI
jgi:hypothetical protein